MMRSLFVGTILGLCLGCAQQAAPADPRVALLEANRAFAHATAAYRLEGWVASFAEDGFMLVPDARVQRGQEAVRATMAPAFADSTFTLDWEPTLAEVSPDGAMGFTVGHYRSSRADSLGQPIVRTGKYLTVWRLGADSAWKAVADVGVADTR